VRFQKKHLFLGAAIVIVPLSGCNQAVQNIKEIPANLSQLNPMQSSAAAQQPAPIDYSTKEYQQIITTRAEMKELQELLNQLGKERNYSAGTVDGFYGNKTKNAIKAFQQSQGMPVDGIATQGLLLATRQVVNSDSGATGSLFPSLNNLPPTAAGKLSTLEACVESSDSAGELIVKSAVEKTSDELPIDIKPYLKGLCLPKRPDALMALYLYLASEGALHASLMQAKYAELFDIYETAGFDLAVEKDAFRRSAATLDSDIKLIGEDRLAGLKQMLGQYEVSNEDTRKALALFAEKYEKLEQKHKVKAKPIIESALAHSLSATFYLSRSTYTGKKILTFSEEALGNGEGFKEIWVKVKQAASTLWLVSTKGEDMGAMLYASTYTIKIFTQDIKGIPMPELSVANNEVSQLRADNGVALSEFDALIAEEQQTILKEV